MRYRSSAPRTLFVTFAAGLARNMTELEHYLHTYFDFDQGELADLVASFFKPEVIRKEAIII